MSAFTSHQNSTIVRPKLLSASLSAARAYFAVASRLVPEIARRQAERLFTLPPRYAGRGRTAVDARREIVVSGKHSLAVWHAGSRSSPAVLLVHGWGGRGVQMSSFVEPLMATGYRVVWFDHPGHGDSGNASVALPDFVQAVQTLGVTHAPFAAAIGHSLGAAALGLALRSGLDLEKVVFVSPPASISEHTRKFAEMLGITPTISDTMREHIEQRYGLRFAEIDRIEALSELRLPALFVHDDDDVEVPFEHTLRLSRRMRDARIIKTYGLGHYRLLRDASVVRAIVAFIDGDVSSVPAELPVLPRPAPIY